MASAAQTTSICSLMDGRRQGHDGLQDVVQVVRHASGEHADRLHALGLPQSQRPVFDREPVVIRGAAHRTDEQIRVVQRLRQVVLGAVLQGVHGRTDAAEPGDQDDGQVSVLLPDVAGQADPIHVRQVFVGDDQVELPGLQRLDGGLGVGYLGDLGARVLQGEGDEFPAILVVVNEEQVQSVQGSSCVRHGSVLSARAMPATKDS
ncbi:MAG: hypothetical protein QME60_02885 [Verrucomicrobiota bacterium]|nr:hypothetical protein [Verrucomicrobiota bacterium]